MRLTADQLAPFGADGGLIHSIDTAFAGETPDRVGVAVSGGGDSMAVLHVAKRWADVTGTVLEAVTVDHGLRAEAAREARMVAAFCATHRIGHTTLAWDGAAARGNIAAAGREARYRLIAGWAKARGIGGVLLGHTQDDIAETFLMRLARKAGVDGLSMMEPRFERNGVRWARPFWQEARADLRAYLQRHDVPWVDDPTNDNEAYERPKARQALAALAPLGITPEVLKTVAMNMASTRSVLEQYTADAAQACVRVEAGDVVIDTAHGADLPSEIRRRLIVAALRCVGGKPYAPRAEAVFDLEVALDAVGKHTLAGCSVTKVGGVIRVTRELAAVQGHAVPFGTVWDGRWQVCGPASERLEVRALGDDLKSVEGWREMGLPRDTLVASPAVYRGDDLVAAPVAGLKHGFEARIVADFSTFLLSR